MKLSKYIHTALTACAAAVAMTMMPSCELEPYVLPPEELYIRNFLKKYGKIDPEQDWTMVTPSEITVIPSQPAKRINVLVTCGGNLYRVAEYRDIDRQVTIPIDVPKGTTDLLVDIDDVRYQARLGGTLDVANYTGSRGDGMSRGAEDYTDMAWLMIAEDLGALDDFDFNDIIVSIETVSVNFKASVGAVDWQISEEDKWIDINTPTSRDDVPTDPQGQPCKRLRVKALTAGGIKPLWLHYNNGENDYVIGYNPAGDNMHDLNKYHILTDEERNTYMGYEWHRWFGVNVNKIILNTGSIEFPNIPTDTRTSLGSQVIYVNNSFTMSQYSYINYDDQMTGDPNNKDNLRPEWSWQTNFDQYDIVGFYITVDGVTLRDCQTTLFKPSKGEAPQMMLIPDVGPNVGGNTKWKWPTERTSITTIYPDFLNWVSNPSNSDWFLNVSPRAVYEADYMRVE